MVVGKLLIGFGRNVWRLGKHIVYRHSKSIQQYRGRRLTCTEHAVDIMPFLTERQD